MRYYSDPCLAVSSLHPDHRARKVQARFEQLTLLASPGQPAADDYDIFDTRDHNTVMAAVQHLSHHLDASDTMDDSQDHADDVFDSHEDVFEANGTTHVAIPQFQALGSPAAKRPLRERRHTYHGDALNGWQPGFHPISSPLRDGAHLKWQA